MTDMPGSALDTGRLATLIDELGDEDIVRQAVQSFLEEIPARLAAIRSALASGDPDELRSSAHALGSPAAMLGAVAVSTSSRTLQAAAAADRDAEYALLVDDLEASTERTEAEMRNYLGSVASA